MATFDDLTEYSYLPTRVPMLNVGWLGRGRDFPRGVVPVGLVDALILLAVDQRNVMRGAHSCEFCDKESPIRIAAPVLGGAVSLGMGEIHVRGRDGETYSAPSLVIHYISEHDYCPPQEFQDAVMDAAGIVEIDGESSDERSGRLQD